MKEYQILTVQTPEEAQAAMNDMARHGWAVKAMTDWQVLLAHCLLITFEKDS